MKKFYLFAAAALAIASCTSDEYTGGQQNQVLSETINFSTLSEKTTRADFEGAKAAAKLNNNFIVYGFKTDAAEALDGSSDQVVFGRYNVNYTEGTAGTTESNTADWEYVGFQSHGSSPVTQTIKYWDHSATNYVFSAVSGVGITAEKITSVTTPAKIYDKGWNITIPQGGSLSDLYASNRLPVLPANYRKQVSLTFYNLGAKIRFAMYETVPGYSIQIKKFYYTDGTEKNSETNFMVDGNFTTLKKNGDTHLKVTYYDDLSGIENRPKVSYEPSGVSTAAFGEFGANIQATNPIGTTSIEATYDQADKGYTDIIPMQGNGLTLKVDYTLTSTDGSGEEINVKGAIANVPVNFTNWKENFAYTYLFKISDNTNGHTGDGSDPSGLYPITFDAVVMGTEDGIQETVTSVASPSITTYQKGVVVTKTDEYEAGDIYFEDGNANVNGYKVYEVHNYGTIENITEEVVANWKNNFCVLTEVSTLSFAPGTGAGGIDPADYIPLLDGTYIKKSKNQAAKFTAEAGKTYVIVNNTADHLDPTTAGAQCKVVKVAGSEASFTTALSATTGTITAADGKAIVSLTQGGVAAIGAKKTFEIKKGSEVVTTQFVIEDAVDGSYTINFTDEAIQSGAAKNNSAGTYTVNMLNEEGNVLATVNFTVTLAYALTTSVDIEAGNTTGADATLTVASTATAGAVIVNENEGITITDNSNGTYTVKAKATVKNGAYTATIGGESLDINVANYQFTPTAYVYNMNTAGALVETTPVALKTYQNTPATATGIGAANITIKLGGSASDAIKLTGSDGSFDVSLKTAGTGNGTYTLTKDNTIAEATVTVNKYTMSNVSGLKKSTGSKTLTIQANGKTINASKANLVIMDALSNDVTSSFTVSTNGSTLTLSNVKSSLAAGTYNATYYLEAGHTNAIATSTIGVVNP